MPFCAVTRPSEFSAERPKQKERYSRCLPRRKSDDEGTLELDVAFDLGAGSDLGDRKGCLKIRTVAESLEQQYTTRCPEKSLSFGFVHIHTHCVTLGDNPSTSSGPPLAIEWKAFDTKMVSLDGYEQLKPQPRKKDAMLLPRVVREDWLRDAGVSRGQIKEMVTQLEVIKQHRVKSAREGRLRRRLLRSFSFRT
jgi:hypothetical protein